MSYVVSVAIGSKKVSFFFFFKLCSDFYIYIYFGCVGSSLVHTDLL